jgi:glycosyltransferase involved in cell wall biosynthesis
MAKELQIQGQHVVVVSASYAHVRFCQPDVKKIFHECMLDGIKFVFLKVPRYRDNSFSRILNMLIFSSLLLIYSFKIAKKFKPRFLIASIPQPFIIFGALSIARKAQAKFILDVRDLWPLTLVSIGKIPNWNPVIILMKLAEKIALRSSALILTSLPKGHHYFSSLGVNSARIVYIPNGVDVSNELRLTELSADTIRYIELCKRLKNEGKFLIGYIGAHGFANALHVLVEGLARVPKEKFALVTIGHGPKKAELKDLAESRNIEAYFLDPISRKSISHVLREFDVVYLGGRKNEELYKYGISPTKLGDYLLAGRVVLHAAAETCEDLVSMIGCGLSIPMEDPQALAQALGQMQSLPKDELSRMGNQGQRYAVENMKWSALVRKMRAEIGKIEGTLNGTDGQYGKRDL